MAIRLAGSSVVNAIYAVSKQADYGYVEATVSFWTPEPG
jgi:hypothetical protein